MIACNCIVQAGQIPPNTQAVLRQKITAFTQKEFGAAADINWTEIPERSGFTAGKPSTSSIISIRANTALPQERRAELLHTLCGMWSDETQSSLNEIVGVLSDPENA